MGVGVSSISRARENKSDYAELRSVFSSGGMATLTFELNFNLKHDIPP